VPRLSHQWPAVVVVAETVGAVDVLVEVTVVDSVVVIGIEVVDVICWVVVVVVDELQDAKMSEVTMRQVSAIQIIPLFIKPSFFI
jgi:hypothetical protein